MKDVIVLTEETEPEGVDVNCPVCESPNVGYYSGIVGEITHAWQVGTCDDCGATWHEVYTLHHIDRFTPGDK